MIIHLDSMYRDIETYPETSYFELEVNANPSSSSRYQDTRTLGVSNAYARFVFRWIGNTMVDGFSTRANDALAIRCTPLNPTTCLFIEPSLTLQNDYFIGCLFTLSSSKTAALITAYDANLRLFELDQPLFQSLFCEDPTASKETMKPLFDGYILNTSFTVNNNLLILGNTSYIPQNTTETFLSKGLNRNLFVENMTKGWTRPIDALEPGKTKYRNIYLPIETLPYDPNDWFIVWGSLMNRYQGTDLFFMGIRKFILSSSSPVGLQVGDVLFDVSKPKGASMEVMSLEPLTLKIIHPGSGYRSGDVVFLQKSETVGVQIRVLESSSGFLIVYGPPCQKNDQESAYLIGLLDISYSRLLYLDPIEKEKHILYIDLTEEDVYQGLKTSYDQEMPIFSFYVIPYQQILPNLVAPIIPYQNAVCYRVTIVSITLPNLPVCGYDVLLADVPYILVSFGNVRGPNNENIGLMYTNNPAAFQSTFVCPIANIRNPAIIKYVVVGSSQVITMKFTPRDALRFRVSLPNGKLLRFSRQAQVARQKTFDYLTPYLKNEDMCIPVDSPMNTLASMGYKKVWAYGELGSYQISATFFLERISE